MKKITQSILALSVVMTGICAVAHAHCQIPCGIYDDDARFTLMREHVTTIEKSMSEITRLGAETPVDNNQLIRWVNNKESHADLLADIVTDYFMAQRVIPVARDEADAYATYETRIALLHQILVQAMKAKQTTDRSRCVELRRLIDAFEADYST